MPMKKNMSHKNNSQRGITLIESLIAIVVAALGILGIDLFWAGVHRTNTWSLASNTWPRATSSFRSN